MKTVIFCKNKKCNLIKCDPRLKVILLLFGNISFFIAPTMEIKNLLVLGFTVLGILSGAIGYSLKMALTYVLLIFLQFLGSAYLSGAMGLMLITCAQFINMILPCALLAGILIKTTTISEFMAALQKMHVSKSVIIPLAVMFRYIPVVSNDWNMIKDAMKMRNLSPSFIGFLKHPSRTIECIYTPLLIAASSTAEDLSAAAITRAVENTEPRTSMIMMKFTIYDYCISVLMVFTIVAEFLVRGGVL